jgi:hypothetical protein
MMGNRILHPFLGRAARAESSNRAAHFATRKRRLDPQINLRQKSHWTGLRRQFNIGWPSRSDNPT